MKVSLLMLSLDRYEVTKNALENNLKNHGFAGELELLFCDNGSQDRRVVDYLESKNPAYFRKNTRNEGCSRAFNQLYLRSTGDFIVLLGNDIELPDRWLNSFVNFHKAIEGATGFPGISGLDWGHGSLPPIKPRDGLNAHWLNETLNRVFGVWFFSKELIETIGFFHEGYDVYGIEDSDFNERVNRMGFNSCYLPHLKSRHMVHDVGEKTDYRKMKDESLGRNLGIFAQRVKAWDLRGKDDLQHLIEPLPPVRDPI